MEKIARILIFLAQVTKLLAINVVFALFVRFVAIVSLINLFISVLRTDRAGVPL